MGTVTVLVVVVATAAAQVHALAIRQCAAELCIIATCAVAVSVGRRSTGTSLLLAGVGLYAALATVVVECLQGPVGLAHWFDQPGTGAIRLGRLFHNPNTLGAHTVVIGYAFLWWAVRCRDRLSRGHRAALWAAFLLSLGMGTATLSRSAFAGWVLGAASLAMLARGRWRKAGGLAAVATGACLVLVLNPWLRVRVEGTMDPGAGTVQHRLFMWRTGLGMLRDHPWCGVGPGVGSAAFAAYREPGRTEEWAVLSDVGTLHNDYLQATVEHGLPGVVLLLIAVVWSLGTRRRSRTFPSGFCWPGLVGLCTTSAFQGDLANVHWVLYAAALLGASWGEALPEAGEAQPRRWREASARMVIGLCVLLELWQVSASSTLGRGTDALAREAVDEAALAARSAERRAPWLAMAHRLEGWCLLRESEETGGNGHLLSLQQAEGCFKRAARWNPYDASCYADLAEVHRRMRYPLDALISDWRSAVKLDSYRASYRGRLAELLVVQGRPGQARAELASAEELYGRQLSILARRGQGERAVASLAQADLFDIRRLASAAQDGVPLVQLTFSPGEEECLSRLRQFVSDSGVQPPTLLVYVTDIWTAPRSRLRLRETGWPCVLCLPWRGWQNQKAWLEWAGIARELNAEPALAIDVSLLARLPEQKESLLDAKRAFSARCGIGLETALWACRSAPRSLAAVSELGFPRHVGASRTTARGLMPAPFRLEQDWPRVVAYLTGVDLAPEEAAATRADVP